MKPEQIYEQLDAISEREDDFAYLSDQLALLWERDPERETFVEPVLRFMENHTTLDFGLPGRLVAFLEAQASLEDLVVASVQRKPMHYTVWMINRLINGRAKRSKSELMAVLEGVSQNKTVEPHLREQALDFISFQDSKLS